VLQDPIIQTEAPARLASTRVSFEPGARTAWHTHPLGQTLIVMSGCGRCSLIGAISLFELHSTSTVLRC
jgi:quercetin dioxygenase-like cupin family protein